MCVVRDFNIQVSESKLLQTLLNTHQWFDAHQLGCPAEQEKHTSHKANGSRIDFVFTNSLAAGLVETYTVVPGVLPKDHSEVHVAFTLPRNAQFRYVVSQPNGHIPVPYDNTPDDYVPQLLIVQLAFVSNSDKTVLMMPSTPGVTLRKTCFTRSHTHSTLVSCMTRVSTEVKFVSRGSVSFPVNETHIPLTYAPDVLPMLLAESKSCCDRHVLDNRA